MSGASITFTFQDEAWARALHRMGAMGRNPTPVLRAIGVGLQHTTIDRFQTATTPEGSPWRGLNPAYAAAPAQPAGGTGAGA